MRIPRVLYLAGVFAAVVVFAGQSQVRVEAIPTPPTIDQSIVGVLVAGEITITGQALGTAPSLREIRFAYDSTSITIDSASPYILAWSATEIRLTLPSAIRSGQIVVTIDGQSSAPVDLDVFEFTKYPLLETTGAKEFPLSLDVDAAGRVWINQEAHDKLNWLIPATASNPAAPRRVAIPQAAGDGIYAGNDGVTDKRTYLSQTGEDLDVASNGDVWFTAGGGYLYVGQYFNTSRIVRYRPSTNQFDCYTVPGDSAEALGVLLDEQTGLVWYTESSLNYGNAISSFLPDTVTSDCLWTPYGAAPRPPVCELDQSIGCHRRYVLPPGLRAPSHLALAPDGSVWFSEFWGNRIVRLDANTGEIVELPLPPPIVRVGPGTYAGSGPWELFFDDAGDLWLSESFDGTVSRIRPSLMQAYDCTVLDASLRNPCVEEIFVGSDGYDEQYIHSVAPGSGGRIWFTYAAGVGYVSTEHSNTTVLLPSTATTGTFGLAGIVEDPVTHDVWFAMFYDKKIGRLRLAQGDGDGVDTPVDNCPTAYNPGQANADRNFIDLSPWNKPFNDLTWPASDSIGDACDVDADNDGLDNEVEETDMAVECPPASSATNPLLRDTDNDLVLDGAECALGSDPASALSRPAPSAPGDADRDGLPDAFEPQIGADPTKKDTDGDKIGDGIEYKSYGTRPDVRNSDGDACADGYEAASLDGSTSVNSLELLLIVLAFGSGSNPNYVPAFDVNRDGSINAGDLLTVTILFGPCKPN